MGEPDRHVTTRRRENAERVALRGGPAVRIIARGGARTTKRILAIDGGGVRGIIPAIALASLYRIDVRLARDYPLDALGKELDALERIGERLAATIDWPAILEGRDDVARVRPGRVTASQYCRDVA